jgi:hypothetical protein
MQYNSKLSPLSKYRNTLRVYYESNSSPMAIVLVPNFSRLSRTVSIVGLADIAEPVNSGPKRWSLDVVPYPEKG